MEVTKTTDPMTGNDVYSVPEPYNYNQNDTCDYDPPQVSLSISGERIIATIRRGSYDVSGYTLYVNGVEQSGISLGDDGVVNGYTLNGTEDSIRFTISDSAGYTGSSEMSLSH